MTHVPPLPSRRPHHDPHHGPVHKGIYYISVVDNPTPMGCGDAARHVAVVGTVVVLLLLGPGCITGPDTSPDLDPMRNIHFGQGNSTYTDHDVIFNVGCVHNVPIDVSDLSVEFILTSSGEPISTGVSNTSEVADPVVFPEFRIFRNVTVPHLGHPEDSLGFIVTLYYKGTEVDRDVYETLEG